MRTARVALSALLLALVGVFSIVAPARADDAAPITKYHVDVNLTPEGVAQVTIDMVMDFSVVSGRGPILFFPEYQDAGDNQPNMQYVFDYSNWQVTSDTGARVDMQQERENGAVGIRVGHQDHRYREPQQYTVSYDVAGFIVSDHPESGMDEFSWNAIGPYWNSSFRDVQISITGPTAVSQADCFYGPYTVQEKCESSVSGDTATFSIDALDSRTPMQVVAGFPAGTFGGVQQTLREIPTFGNTMRNFFEVTPVTAGATGVSLAAAVLGWVAVRRRFTRDEVFVGLTPGVTPARGQEAARGKQQGKTTVAVQFQPPKGSTPGEIGTLMDATANNIDISATIVDLAVRRYLRIETLPSQEIRLVQLPIPPQSGELKAFEAKLLTKLFKTGPVVTMDDLKGERYATLQPKTKERLYKQMVANRWFHRRPDYAVVAPLVAGILLTIGGFMVTLVLGMAGWGLVGIPLVLFGIGILALTGKFRTRTAEGSAVLAQTKGFELYLRTAEADQIKFEEGIDVFSRYLPYAMIFGVADRWAKVFSELGESGVYQADLSWYPGANLYNAFYFSSALNTMSSALSSAMTTAVASGMTSSTGSSSGFSGFSGGGGFGGGGGGSW
ncbi:DUF2207 domain-containing protein [Tessaracoccus caeni]|uniref:DUF2207 domain-containing protein n=1 Tax=Tessaracoccus caeni TaxID=3031239 RepID=UPI0023D97E3F|nr:DUF2207 domain-containing protein [Tessaracoccus caeni]MDF1488886.1 DUF2207 domain-containing protein [Tessaracoccus caeni]